LWHRVGEWTFRPAVAEIGEALTTDETQLLSDRLHSACVLIIDAAGDADQNGAAYVVRVYQPLIGRDGPRVFVVSPGVYLRTVNGKHVATYPLGSVDAASAHLAALKNG
jgi:hypothetical protein